jgi:hypothetical protein
MALTKFRASPLPNAPAQYDPQHIRQMIRVIETYFSQLDSNTPNYAQSYTADFFYGDGTGIYVPYNQFQSRVDQTAAAIDQAYAIRLEVTDFVNGISITGVNNTRITFSEPGMYNVAYSLQFKNTVNDLETIDIWLRYKGVDIPDTNTRFAIPPRKSTGDPSFLVAVTPLMLTVAAVNDYIEIMWRVSNVNVILEHLPAVAAVPGVTPAIPATPSAIVEAFFVSKAV